MIAPLLTAALLFATPVVSDPVEVDIMSLTNIEWEEGDPLPDWIERLDGREVVISGYMNIGDRNTDVSEFLIVSDSCNCTGTPKLQHFVQVTLTSGTTGLRPGLQTFRGTFEASEKEEDGFITSLFRLDGDFF